MWHKPHGCLVYFSRPSKILEAVSITTMHEKGGEGRNRPLSRFPRIVHNRAIRRCTVASGASRFLVGLVQPPARTPHVRVPRPVLPPLRWRLLLVIVCTHPLRDGRNRTKHHNYGRHVKALPHTGFDASQAPWTPELYVCHVVFQILCISHRDWQILSVGGAPMRTVYTHLEKTQGVGMRSKMRMKPYLVNYPGALILFQARLHLGKSTKDCLGFVDLLFLVPEELERGLEHIARLVNLATFVFKFAPFDPHTRFGADGDPALVNGAGTIQFVVSSLKLDIGLPCLVIRLPRHPSLKDLPSTGNVLEKFF